MARGREKRPALRALPTKGEATRLKREWVANTRPMDHAVAPSSWAAKGKVGAARGGGGEGEGEGGRGKTKKREAR